METQKKTNQRVKNSNRCSKCNSTFGYLRIKEKEWVCRNCGNVKKIGYEEKEEKEGEE